MMHNYREPEKWLELAVTKNSGQQKRKPLKFEERRDEIILMSLRLGEGLSSAHFNSLTNQSLLGSLNQSRLKILSDEGFITFNDDVLKATPSGLQRLNAVLAHLLA
jgi:coproporphyrinogen III oxidase-like Fe-S oxidoreductase